uniref:Uncharacterized protein n=1 Tax=Megaselia scalaris TaxID=36166 RepID=T1H296_MEGSC
MKVRIQNENFSRICYCRIVATMVVANDLEDMDFGDKESMQECAKELKIDMTSKDIEEDKIKCLFKCFMEKEGIMKDGIIDMKESEKAIRNEEKIKEEDKGHAISAIPACIEEAKEGDDCQKAFDFTVCMLNSLDE